MGLKTAENFGQSALPPKPVPSKTAENFNMVPKVGDL
jgi:hypothetical protein